MEPLFTKTEIKGVDINLLYETPLQSFEMDEIPELKQSIRLYGLLTPLTVCMDDGGKCEVLSGNRRYRAIKELRQEKVIKGYDEIPCMVLSGLSEAKKGLIVETTNTVSYTHLDVYKRQCFNNAAIATKVNITGQSKNATEIAATADNHNVLVNGKEVIINN